MENLFHANCPRLNSEERNLIFVAKKLIRDKEKTQVRKILDVHHRQKEFGQHVLETYLASKLIIFQVKGATSGDLLYIYLYLYLYLGERKSCISC